MLFTACLLHLCSVLVIKLFNLCSSNCITLNFLVYLCCDRVLTPVKYPLLDLHYPITETNPHHVKGWEWFVYLRVVTLLNVWLFSCLRLRTLMTLRISLHWPDVAGSDLLLSHLMTPGPLTALQVVKKQMGGVKSGFNCVFPPQTFTFTLWCLF